MINHKFTLVDFVVKKHNIIRTILTYQGKMIGLYIQFFYFCIRNFRICFTFGTEHNIFTITSKGKITIALTIPEDAIERPTYISVHVDLSKWCCHSIDNMPLQYRNSTTSYNFIYKYFSKCIFSSLNQSSHPLIMSTWESPTEIYITLDVIPSVGLQCGSPNLPGDMKGSH